MTRALMRSVDRGNVPFGGPRPPSPSPPRKLPSSLFRMKRVRRRQSKVKFQNLTCDYFLGVPVPVNIAAATSSSIDESQYMAEGASPSSNSDSPSAGPLDESTFDSFFAAAASEQEHGISNLWTGSVSIQQQQQQQHYSTWTTFNGVMDSHHPHAGVELGQGLSSGIGGYGGFPSSAQHLHI